MSIDPQQVRNANLQTVPPSEFEVNNVPTLVERSDGGDRNSPAGIEILQRTHKEGRWLVAWFEDGINLFFVGELDISANPWRLRRIRERSQLLEWPALSTAKGIGSTIDGLLPEQGFVNQTSKMIQKAVKSNYDKVPQFPCPNSDVFPFVPDPGAAI